jgi:hypothetical protein
MLSQLVLEFCILLPLNVDEILLDLLLSNLLPELSLAFLAHEFGKNSSEHGELRLLPMIQGLCEDSLHMLFVMHIFLPCSELLAHRSCATSHNVITQ